MGKVRTERGLSKMHFPFPLILALETNIVTMLQSEEGTKATNCISELLETSWNKCCFCIWPGPLRNYPMCFVKNVIELGALKCLFLIYRYNKHFAQLHGGPY